MDGFHGRIGVGRRDITPPVGIYARSWGAAVHDAAEGVHRPLTVTALAFVADDAPIVIASLDLGWWMSREDELLVRGALLDDLELPTERAFVHLTHTHAGPSLSRANADRPGGEKIAPYLECVRAALRSAAMDAIATAVSARLEVATGRCDLAVNRDLPEPGGDGRTFVVGWNPAEPADDTVTVARITRDDGTALAAIVHYACHPTTLGPGNRVISPDYVGAVREVVEAETGAPCLFLQGASGELSPAWQFVADPAVPDAHGRKLGHAALAALLGMPPVGTQLTYVRRVESGAPLGVYEPSSVALRTDLSADIAAVSLPLKSEVVAVLPDATDPAAVERRRRAELVKRSVGDGPSCTVPFYRLSLGGLTLIGVPGEAYNALQSALRRPDETVLVCNVTNGWYGYFPPRAIYECGYIYSSAQSPFAPGCHEAIEAALSA